ncbi:MAG: hypothetical protein M0006_06745 [Magnetospirillum sp.]|nr:hypothetical protein [Magnetospirillum sp.]
MPLIATQSPEAATGDVAEVYGQVKKRLGIVPTPIQLLSASPFLLKNRQEAMSYYWNHPNIGMAVLAVIRMLASIQARCAYCIDRNASVLIDVCEWTADQVTATREDIGNSPLAPREQALVALSIKAVRDSLSVTAGDVDAVRAQGWTDGDIFDAVNHGAQAVALDILFNTFKIERDF